MNTRATIGQAPALAWTVACPPSSTEAVYPGWVYGGSRGSPSTDSRLEAAGAVAAQLDSARVHGAIAFGDGWEPFGYGRKSFRIDTVRVDPLGAPRRDLEPAHLFSLGAVAGVLAAPEGTTAGGCDGPDRAGGLPAWVEVLGQSPPGWRSAVGEALWTRHAEAAWRRALERALVQLALAEEVTVRSLRKLWEDGGSDGDVAMATLEVDAILRGVRLLGLHYSPETRSVYVWVGVRQTSG